MTVCQLGLQSLTQTRCYLAIKYSYPLAIKYLSE